ncbi:MAG: divalent-cation tolerance protein CutA [Gammaproteobacteria bacterium]|nr:divalent-cation tolerance protein CutA [Gammaproteobacteria bacterium]
MTYHIVLNTCPDEETAERIANALLDQRLAACINIVPGLRSIYNWKGKRENGTEVLLMIKSPVAVYAELETVLRGMHPYELPEIIAVPISAGLTAYLEWIGSETQS